MKAFVLLAVAFATIGCSNYSSSGSTISKCYTEAYHYAGECKHGDYVVRYKALESGLVKSKKGQCVVNIKGSFVVNSDSKQYVCLNGIRKNGADVRTLTAELGLMTFNKSISNVTADTSGFGGCTEGFKGERIEGYVYIDYVPKDQFDIRDYQIDFGSVTLNVGDDWECKQEKFPI